MQINLSLPKKLKFIAENLVIKKITGPDSIAGEFFETFKA